MEFGSTDDETEVGTFLAEVTSHLEQMAGELAQARTQREDFERALRDAAARAEELVRKLGAAANALSGVEIRIEQISSSTRAQAERMLAAAQTGAERIVAEARAAAEQTRARAAECVAELSTKVGALLALHEEFGRSLDAVQARHGELFDALAQLRSDARERVLPLLERLQRAVIGAPETDDLTGRAGRTAGAGEAARHGEPPVTDHVVPAAGPAVRQPAAGGARPHTGAELVVSPFASYFEMTKFLTALSQLTEVKKARVRRFSEGTATFDVALAGELNISRIAGYPLDIVERAGRRLVLRRTGN